MLATSVVGAAVVVVGFVALGAFPVGVMRSTVESRLSAALDTKVHVGAVTRDTLFSYNPVVSVRDVRIAQPAWVGPGDFVRVETAQVRVPMFSLLFGHFRPDRISIDGARIALVRDASGKENWKPDHPKSKSGGDDRPSLSDLTITHSQVVIRDARRGLVIDGPLSVDAAHGLRYAATGTFRDTPARLELTGGKITGIDPTAPYPFAATLESPALRMAVKGTMRGVLDTRHFSADVTAQAPTLKNLDRIIEAGLFGSQPINLAGKIRHDGRDWYVDKIGGSMGRSLFSGVATIHKDGGRTTIDAKVDARQFDFDDLADAEGRAESAARNAAVGPRVIPPTRINLSKLGKTDGRLVFVAHRLLSSSGTVFKSLSGSLTLDHRVVTVRDIVATLANGRMTGVVKVDHRSGAPKLAIDLRLAGLTLDALVGQPKMISGPVRGHIVLTGQGDTVREAMAHASGKAAIVATDGHVQRMVADVLGQNLSGAVAHAIGGPSETVPLRCLVANFRATGGVLTPNPLAIDTGASVGRGSGRILLDGERLELTLAGASKSNALLRIADPIHVRGTLGSPTVTVAGLGASEKPTAGGVLRVLGRSIGQALGITKTPPSAAGRPPTTVNCSAAVALALR
nr:AsmA family protein [Sphingomonas sp. CARO-RG-8B-R24-01]